MYKENSTTGGFVIHEHHAKNLHYDFRLQMGGALKSWAVPKNIPLKKGIKRLAIEVEDHPLDYIDFQGEIPAGQYGAGRVLIWDNGGYELKSTSKKKIEFLLHGKKAKGRFMLLHLKDKQWLIFMR